MSKNKALFILSLLLVVLPYVGFPKSWEDSLISIIGLVLLYITYLYVKSGRMHIAEHKVIGESKKVYSTEGEFIGSEIDVIEKMVIESEGDTQKTQQ